MDTTSHLRLSKGVPRGLHNSRMGGTSRLIGHPIGKNLRVARPSLYQCHMVLRWNGGVSATQPQAGLDEAIREAQEGLDQFYPADWDYYEDVVAKNPPNGKVTVPHKITGDLVRVDLLTLTPDEIIEQCGIPDHMREESLLAYRLFLKARLPFWDRRLLPNSVPLLDKGTR